jgi:hypothetical protein
MKYAFLSSVLSQLAIITLALIILYACVQQTYRTGANDPQIQIAQDIATRLSAGRSVDHYFTGDTLDISSSLSVFAALYNSAGQPVMATGYLNGKMPQLPSGVFGFANQWGENRISWQPQQGVRIAMVIQKVSSSDIGFVGVGRSLKEVEIRENNLGRMILIGWLICIGILIVNTWVQFKHERKSGH